LRKREPTRKDKRIITKNMEVREGSSRGGVNRARASGGKNGFIGSLEKAGSEEKHSLAKGEGEGEADKTEEPPLKKKPSPAKVGGNRNTKKKGEIKERSKYTVQESRVEGGDKGES